MKIKRFVAKSMRHALRQVREEQGPDAVILSNRTVPEGVEVVAAVDYDETLMGAVPAQMPSHEAHANDAVEPAATEQPVAPETARGAAAKPAFDDFMQVATAVASAPPATALDLAADPTIRGLKSQLDGMRALLEDQLATLIWRDAQGVCAERVGLLRELSELGLDADIAARLAERTFASFDARSAAAECPTVLAGSVPVVAEDLCDQGGVFAIVGPTGVGKTTTVAKLAARYALKHGRESLALVSTDTFRIGAQEQLATFAQILEVPVHLARDRAELSSVLTGLADRRLVLIDTAGVSQRDGALDGSLAILDDTQHAPKRLLALPANVQRDTLREVIESFSARPLNALVITKLDEAASFGATLSTVLRHDIPVAYLTDGQRVPEDIYPAAPKRQWWANEAWRRRDRSGRRSEESILARQFSEVVQNAHA